MAGFETRIEVDDRLTGPLAGLVDAAGNLREPMRDLSVEMLRHTQDRFIGEFGPDGVPWKPSAAALREGRPTLYDRGDLYYGLESDSGDDFAAVGVQATGGPARYARIHQEGGTISSKSGGALRTPFGPRASVNMPARPFLGIEERDLATAEAILIAHLRRGLGSEGASA